MIRARCMKWRSTLRVLYYCAIVDPSHVEGILYRKVVRPVMLYGAQRWAIKKQHVHKMGVTEMRILRCMCGHKRMNRMG